MRGVIGAIGLLVLGIAAAVFSAPVAASVYTATFTGTLYGAADFAGLFGAPGTDISGQAFTVVYRVDTGVPGIVDFAAGNGRYLYSGAYYYSGLPTAMSATMTVGGHTVGLTGNYKGQIVQGNGFTPLGKVGNGDEISYILDSTDYASRYDSISFSIGSFGEFVSTANFDAPGHYSFASTVSDNRFSFANGTNEAYGSLHATDLVVAEAGAVPEPAAWAMLLTGFVLTGAAARRRSSSRVVAA